MKRICMMIILAVFIGLNCHAYAASNAQEILKAVVKIHSVIPKETPSSETLGTEREGHGIVIDAEGAILTIGYLVRGAEKIYVTGPEGKPVAATVSGYDNNTGFAIVRTERPLGVVPIEIGQSSTVTVGDPILVAGYEAAQAASVISRKELAGYWEYLVEEAIYTVPAFANFSGAALIDRRGHLVGIGSLFTQIFMKGIGSLPCNVFVPIDLLKPVLATLKMEKRSQEMPRPWLGINAEEAHGRIFITKVTSGGPAEKAGLKPGDIVLMVEGREVAGLADCYRKIWGIGNAGVQVPLTILQGSKIIEIKVSSTDRQRAFKLNNRNGITL